MASDKDITSSCVIQNIRHDTTSRVLYFHLCIAQEYSQNGLENFGNLQASFSGLNSDINSQSSDIQNEAQNQQNQKNQNQVEATTFEIKASLNKCSKPRPCDCDSTFECGLNKTQNNVIRTKEHRTRCEEEADENILQNCQKKISLTLKIKNRGKTNCKPQYIILDHVFDVATDKKQKILNPYVLKISQKPVFQMYDLIFENAVNSGPSEKVLNKNDEGYTGCSTDPANPTCGSVQYDNKEVPYSTGFCCSCDKFRGEDGTGSNLDSLVSTFTKQGDNKIRQNDDQHVQKDISNLDIPNLNDPAINSDVGLKDTNMPYLPGDNKNDYEHYGFTDKSGKIKENEGSINAQNIIPDNIGSAPRIGRQSIVKDSKDHRNSPKRAIHLNKKHIQKRGGQDCDDMRIPQNADPETYHDSAHCMEFSDVWYSIYRITHPDIDHFIKIQIFEKIGMKGRNINWREITFTSPILIGTSNLRFASDDGNILAYYTVNNQIESEFALDGKTHRLLIPEITGRDVNKNQYPEIQGGPGEYLVVKDSDMDLSGKSCNKAGVGYEAFARQPRKCDVERNSCLQNQPKQMWQHDHDLEEKGKKGCYFLKNYGYLPDNPVRMKPCNGTSKKSQNKLLHMFYTSWLTSTVNINFAADMNVILRPDGLAMITEVYTETLNPKKVTIIAKVLNSGLVTSIFHVGIGACPMDIPASFGSITSQPVLIAPQNQHVFILEIYCELPIKKFYCSLEVLNMKEQLIAIRRIRFERMDRCYCVWYCQCNCFNSDYSLKCSPLEIEQFHAAGFQGGMPIPTQVVNYSAFDDIISIIFHFVFYFCLTFWYMGLIKAVLGCCVLPIGLWGLDKILDLPKKLNRYYEPELQHQVVVYDNEGWPIHPETGKKVHNVAPPTQFAINMVFFFLFPFAIIWNLCKKLLAPKYSPDQMFGDLDICKCKASQISLLRDNSLQNSTNKRSATDRNKVSYTDLKEDSQSSKSKDKNVYSKDSGSQVVSDSNKKKSKGSLLTCLKSSKEK